MMKLHKNLIFFIFLFMFSLQVARERLAWLGKTKYYERSLSIPQIPYVTLFAPRHLHHQLSLLHTVTGEKMEVKIH